MRGFENTGKVWHIDSVQAYFECSMDLLKDDVRADVFPDDRPVLTKLKDEMPTKYVKGCQVKNSLIADGCIVEGTVENSILFRGVHVEKGAVVKNSIIMQDGLIQKGAELQHCILDKQATVREGQAVIGPRSYPVVIAKDQIV